ncbi:MAG TPA: hypothetical protein VMF89_32140 [Polyangiales bacterium]|nr:hypothetical protein [Polyangiales bacterium]
MVCGLFLLAACSDPKPAREPAVKPAAVQPAPVSQPASQIVQSLPLGQRLARESDLHPSARRHAENLLSHFHQNGVTLLRIKQVLAETLGADYCASSVSTSGIGVVVCEFGDATAAERGLKISHDTFDRILPGRTLLVQRSTMVTVTKPASDAARLELVRLRDLFSQPLPGARASL